MIGSPVDPDEVRDVACELTASGTTCSPPTPDPSDFDLPDVPAAGSAAVFGGALSTLLVVLLVAALVALIVWVVVTAVRGRSDVDGEDVDDLDEDLDGVGVRRIVDDERPPDRWRAAAREHREAGRFRDAVRCEYRALVGELARAGLVDEIPGRTSGEEREQVAEIAAASPDRYPPAVPTAFGVAADLFDTAWFDDAVVTADDDERFLVARAAVLDHVLSKGDGR